MTVIEIEDYYGNTIGYFRIKNTKKEDIVDMLHDFEIADVESDYLCNTDEPLLRLQSTFKELRFGDFGKDNMECDICKKNSDDVRFEGSEEMNICDGCLETIKKQRYQNDKGI